MGRPPSVGGRYQSRKMESVTQLPAALSLWRLVRLTMALLGLPGTSYRGQSPSSPISLRPRLQGEQSRYSKSELPARDWNFFCFLEEELPMMGGEGRGSHCHSVTTAVRHNSQQTSIVTSCTAREHLEYWHCPHSKIFTFSRRPTHAAFSSHESGKIFTLQPSQK